MFVRKEAVANRSLSGKSKPRLSSPTHVGGCCYQFVARSSVRQTSLFLCKATVGSKTLKLSWLQISHEEVYFPAPNSVCRTPQRARTSSPPLPLIGKVIHSFLSCLEPSLSLSLPCQSRIFLWRTMRDQGWRNGSTLLWRERRGHRRRRRRGSHLS